MNKYLSMEQLKANLRAGKAVEQWLSYVSYTEYGVILWLRIDREPNRDFTVAYYESFDDGNANFLDIYAFSLVDPDEPQGKLQTFETIDEAVDYCITSFLASAEKFVTAGMIQREYETYLGSTKE